jgi:hypothetical protein
LLDTAAGAYTGRGCNWPLLFSDHRLLAIGHQLFGFAHTPYAISHKLFGLWPYAIGYKLFIAACAALIV